MNLHKILNKNKLIQVSQYHWLNVKILYKKNPLNVYFFLSRHMTKENFKNKENGACGARIDDRL